MSSDEQLFALESLWHLVVDDALGQPLDDRRLAHSGLADEHRVVLGSALEHLHRATNLVVAADHRVELALFGPLGEVLGVALQRLALVFGIGAVDLLPTPDLVDRRLDRSLVRARAPHDLAQGPLILDRCEQKKFARDVLIVALLGELVGHIEQPVEIRRDVDLAGGSLNLGQTIEGFHELESKLIGVDPGPAE